MDLDLAAERKDRFFCVQPATLAALEVRAVLSVGQLAWVSSGTSQLLSALSAGRASDDHPKLSPKQQTRIPHLSQFFGSKLTVG